MATYRTSNAGGGTTGTGNRTATISAVAGDHLTVYVKWSGNNATNPTCTDDQSGTYDLVLTALNNASADIMAIFVRKQQVQTTATITVAPVVGSGTNTAGEIVIVAVTGMTRMGSNSIRQSAKQENQTAGVPTPVLGASALTGNLTVTAAGSTTTAGAVPNASWTERQDVSQSSPVTAIEVATRDSGFTGTSAAYVSIASGVWSSAILEFDTTVPDFAYFDKEQWSVPDGYKARSNRPIELLTWDTNLLQSTLTPSVVSVPGFLLRSPLITSIQNKKYPVAWDVQNLLGTTLGATAIPFTADDWPVPRGPSRSIDLLTSTGSLLTTTLISLAAYDTLRSPLFTRIEPRGFPISLRHWDQGNLLGTLLGAIATPFSMDDWPVPRGPVPAIDLRTWTDQLNVLAGKDKFFGLAGNPSFDWPNPRGAVPPVDLRTWLESTTYLIGKDSFFGLAGHPNFDWPNPRGSAFPSDLRTLTETITYLIGKDQLPTLNYDWPNPRGATPVVDLKTWLKTTLYLIGSDQFFGLAGHPNFDWPNPRGPQFPSDLRTWLERYKLELIGQDQLPELNVQWPNPPGPAFAVELRTWLERYKLELIGQDALPELNVQWPNPRGPVPPIDLKTWVETTVYLLGYDQLPVRNLDWTVPKGALAGMRQADQVDLLNTLLAAFGVPFNMTDWPNPTGRKAGQVLTLTGNPNLLPPTPVTAEQLRQIIRFAPLAFGGRTHWTR